MKNENAMTETYNGYANWATWNVCLWIQNNEGLYNLAREARNYQEVVTALFECGSKETPDGCRWNDPAIDGIEVNAMLAEL